MTQARKRSSPPPIVLIVLGLMLVAAVPKAVSMIQRSLSQSASDSRISSRISSGERSLLASGATPEKQKGVEAYAKKDYSAALEQFEAAL